MENATDRDVKQSPFPQNLTERETRPVQALYTVEAITPQEYFKDRRYEGSDFWKVKYHQYAEWASRARDLHKDPVREAKYDLYQDYCSDMWWDAEKREKDRFEKEQAKLARNEKEREELGPREFTLTYSPAWYSSDEDAQQAFKVAIDKLTRYYKHEIKEFHAVGEFTEAGRAHVHAYYLLEGGRKITDKNFKRAYSHWNTKKKLGKGHEGGHHASVKRISDFAGYTEKHLEEAWMSIHINNADDNPSTLRSNQAPELPQAGGPDPQAPSK